MSSFLKKIIRNDAMKEDPVEIYGWRAFVLTGTVCFKLINAPETYNSDSHDKFD